MNKKNDIRHHGFDHAQRIRTSFFLSKILHFYFENTPENISENKKLNDFPYYKYAREDIEKERKR